MDGCGVGTQLLAMQAIATCQAAFAAPIFFGGSHLRQWHGHTIDGFEDDLWAERIYGEVSEPCIKHNWNPNHEYEGERHESNRLPCLKNLSGAILKRTRLPESFSVKTMRSHCSNWAAILQTTCAWDALWNMLALQRSNNDIFEVDTDELYRKAHFWWLLWIRLFCQ